MNCKKGKHFKNFLKGLLKVFFVWMIGMGINGEKVFALEKASQEESFCSLPDEIWPQILSRTTPLDLVSFSQVSKRARDLTLKIYKSSPLYATEKMSTPQLIDHIKQASPSKLPFFMRILNNRLPCPPSSYWLFLFIYNEEEKKESQTYRKLPPGKNINLMEDCYWEIPGVRHEVGRFCILFQAFEEKIERHEKNKMPFIWLMRKIFEKEQNKFTEDEKETVVFLIETLYDSLEKNASTEPTLTDYKKKLIDLIVPKLEENKKVSPPLFFHRKNYEKKLPFFIAIVGGIGAGILTEGFLREKALSWGRKKGKGLKDFLLARKWIKEEGWISSRIEPFIGQTSRFAPAVAMALLVGLGAGQICDRFYCHFPLRKQPYNRLR